ncbi:MAG: hypothetical protein H0V73_03640, partial [Chloroflexi bacterium]|nr:hypothetical protein [Chloroflexota bacterium]
MRSLLVALGFVLAACNVVPSHSPSPVSTSDASPPVASAIAIDDSVCGLERQPGPADRAPGAGGDGVDLADRGGGRWRLCLENPVALVVEGPAWCTWNDQRTAVTETSGLPVAIEGGDGKMDGGLSLERGEVYLSRTGLAGDVAAWHGGPAGQLIQSSGDGSAGVARFRVAALADSERPPAVRPPDQVGTIRWACGE